MRSALTRSALTRSALVCALLFCVGPTALLAGEDNPFKKAKVGDWVEHKMTGLDVGGTTKMTIVAKDDKEVTYEIKSTFSFMGKEMTGPVQTQKTDLTKNYDLIAAANEKQVNLKREKLAEGAEKIKIAGKELETKWTHLKITVTVNGMLMVSEYKMWFSKDVPVNGLVRMDTEVGTTKTRLELTGWGSK